MNLKEAIKKNAVEFLSLWESHDVKTLYAFGSSTNEKLNDVSSDIDLLIELDIIDPMKSGENLIDLWDKFEIIF